MAELDLIITLQTEDALASCGVSEATLTTAQRTALDERGYLILPDVVGQVELDRLRSAFDRASDAEGIPSSGTRHPKALLAHDQGFTGFLTHSTVLASIWHVLRRPFHGGGSGRDPLPGYGQQGLHVDLAETGPTTPYQVVTTLGLIDDFTPDSGATRLVPGSHRARRPPPKSFADPASRHPDQVIVTATAGSVLVFNGHLWHGGTCNRSGKHRRVVQCSFRGLAPTV